MSYENLNSVFQNVLKFYQQLTGEEGRIPFIFDDFHFCRSRVIGLDMTENMIFNLCRYPCYPIALLLSGTSCIMNKIAKEWEYRMHCVLI
jgi:hypothetical protein